MLEVQSPYVEAVSGDLNGRSAKAYLSRELADPVWDDFLQRTSQGHFQQSSLWAQAKSIEGWRPSRVIVKIDGEIAGGFQILWRRSRLGNIGYIYKGPVCPKDDSEAAVFLVRLINWAARMERLSALIVQPPDETTIGSGVFAQHRFLPNHIKGVISATLVMDVSRGIDVIKREMRKTTLLEIKMAQARGITVREGGDKEIGVFFKLMLATCQRQRTRPAPATEAALRQVWKAFNPQGKIRLFLAGFEGRPVAAVLCLCFGNRVTLWKKGWSGEQSLRKPSQLVMFEAMQWSHANGYRLFDCAGMDRGIAESLLRGEPLSEVQKQSRHFFLLGFGGEPVLLPESKVLIRNPFVSLVYRFLIGTSWGRKVSARVFGGD